MKTSYLFLADGFEEIEALATTDILRRGQVEVKTVSVYDRKEVKGAHGITVIADECISECDFGTADWLILPGGLPGADNLLACTTLCEALKSHQEGGGRIAAICASPGVVLAPLGILEGKKATVYPGFEDRLKAGGATPTGDRVTIDGKITTGNGPSSAFVFALSIVDQTKGAEAARQVASGMLL